MKPHGGRLVSRISERDTAGMEELIISDDLANDVENVADGVFSPLEGFLGKADFEAVVSGGRLSDGTAWTVPVVLDLDEQAARRASDSREVLLRNAAGTCRAVMEVSETFSYDKKKFSEGVYGTSDPAHPGVARVGSMKPVLAGGRITLVGRPGREGLREYRMTPEQTRSAFEKAGWKSVCAFQTRNPPHVAHEMLQKASIATRDGVFVNPLIGRKKAGDFADPVIVRAYEEMIRHYYPPNRCMLATLHTEMRYAGPKEAVHHAIMRQNYGCTHIIIGRDHAGVGKYYDPFAAHRIFDQYPELGIEPVFFPAFFYCRKCLTFTNPRACPHGEGEREQISGTRLREMLQAGEAPSEYILRPEVARVIMDSPEPFVE